MPMSPPAPPVASSGGRGVVFTSKAPVAWSVMGASFRRVFDAGAWSSALAGKPRHAQSMILVRIRASAQMQLPAWVRGRSFRGRFFKVALHLDRVSLSDIWECWGMHVPVWENKTDRGRGWATRPTCQSVPRGTFCRGIVVRIIRYGH